MVWLKIKDLVMDPEYYPREKTDPITVGRYKRAMEAGAKFPEILVGKRNNRYIVIDGWHRIEAMKQLGKESIAAFVTRAPENEWFAEAVKANIAHGEKLTSYDIARAILRLEEQGLSKAKISEIVRIPINKIEKFIERRVVRDEFNKPIVLKAPLKHFAKIGETVSGSAIKSAQEKIGGGPYQTTLLERGIRLLENDLVDLNSKIVRERLQRLKELLSELPL